MEKEIALIPPGPYCYSGETPRPYYGVKTLNGVIVPWCNHLKAGGIDNGHSKEEWKKELIKEVEDISWITEITGDR